MADPILMTQPAFNGGFIATWTREGRRVQGDYIGRGATEESARKALIGITPFGVMMGELAYFTSQSSRQVFPV